jgi:hypothetical protein
VDTDPAAEALVRGYLERLRAAGWALAPERRNELVAEVREHIDTALRVDPATAGSAEVATRNVLERLGPPEEIVRAESEGMPHALQPPPPSVAPALSAPESPWGGLEIAAVALLALGGLLLPGLGPLVGLALAWSSPRWTTPQKLVATGLSVLPMLAGVLAVAALVAGRP